MEIQPHEMEGCLGTISIGHVKRLLNFKLFCKEVARFENVVRIFISKG